MSETRDRVEELWRGTGGTAYAEYLIVLVLVSLVGAAAVAAIGIPLLDNFRFAVTLIAMPVP